MREHPRKIAHMLFGFMILALIRLSPDPGFHLLLLTITGLFLSMASLRWKIPIIEFCLQKFDRSKDRETLPGKGALFFAFSALLVTILFEQHIALAAIAILTFGDPIAQMVGVTGRWQHKINADKTWEGTIAGIICATAAAAFFVPFSVALIASCIAMLIEALPPSIDDNLHIPLIASVVISLLL